MTTRGGPGVINKNKIICKKIKKSVGNIIFMTTEMQTVYGNIKFGPGGQNTAKPMILFQVRCKGDTCEEKLKTLCI